MSSQFDSLLDFGDDPPPSTNGTSQQPNGDDFDPFGPGPMDSGKGGSSDGGLLLDFSVTTNDSTTKNGTADPFGSQFGVTCDSNNSNDLINTTSNSSSNNPFADMSATDTQPSANPLYDLMDDDHHLTQQSQAPVNPLYDMSDDNLTFDSQVTTSGPDDSSSQSANPLYDLMDGDQAQISVEVNQTENNAASDDLLGMDFGGSGSVPVEGKSDPFSDDPLMQSNNNYGDEDQMVPDMAAEQLAGPGDVAQEEEEEVATAGEQDVELFIREEGEDQVKQDVVVGDVKEEEEVSQQEVAEYQAEKERSRSRSRSPSRHSISSEGEVLNEEEEMRQDERALYQAQEEQAVLESRGEEAAQFVDQQEDEGQEDGHLSREQDVQEVQDMSAMRIQKTQEPAPQQQQQKQQQQPQQEQQAAPTTTHSWEEDPEEGVYENEPEQRSDVARETDRNIGAELPSVGTAKSMRDKFVSGQVENKSEDMKRETTPPAVVDGGVYENQPQYNPDVVHAGDNNDTEALPEEGTTRNLAARFKELEKQGCVPVPSPTKRELTPDKTGKVEYVSEPRGHVEKYEPEVQAGVYESQPAERDDVVKSDQAADDILPEKGSAKSMAQRFKQMSVEKSSQDIPRGKRELTPDTSGRVEYVSEPTGFVEKYEGRTESGVFESQPADRDDVVKADEYKEDILPEQGTARNIAARFKEMEKTSKSPPSPTKYKEFTPPRENGTAPQSAGVFENTPQSSADVVHSDDHVEEVLPEKGMAKSLANRFRQMGAGDNSASSPRSKKEFTPPPGDAGVFENTPKQFVPDYNKPAESGILESKPEQRDDVVRADDPSPSEQELPERGYTKNLLSAWRQKESESSKGSPPSTGKPKEFTPPREEPRVAQQRAAPRTPKSPLAGSEMNDGSVHPADLPGQYQPQAEASVFESEPEKRNDVAREEDTDWSQGMPKADTTKKMLAKFKHIQEQSGGNNSPSPKKPTPQARKEGEDINNSQASPDKVGRSKSMRVAVQLEKCGACQKTVYAMEKIEIEKHSYHKSCFRCSHCHCILTPKTFAINKNVMFCTNHYKQLFATKGNYDEGFGRDQHKKRWKSEPNLAGDEQNMTVAAQH